MLAALQFGRGGDVIFQQREYFGGDRFSVPPRTVTKRAVKILGYIFYV